MRFTTFQRIVMFCVSFTFLCAQDVTFTLNGNNLDYVSSAPLYGIQFNHDGCITGASGGDAAAAGITVSVASSVVLSFSMSGGFIQPGSGTFTVFTGNPTVGCILEEPAMVVSGAAGSVLTYQLVASASDPVVSIISPADGASFEGNSISVEVSLQDGNDGDHYHAYLDGDMQGMFYTDSFTLTATSYGSHTLTITLADSGHTEYDGISASSSFTNTAPTISGCTDSAACNYDASANSDDGTCTYPTDGNHDCTGDCTAGYDCNNVCGGTAVDDECGVCGGGGAAHTCSDGSTACTADDCPADEDPTATLSFANVTSSGADIEYTSNTGIFGFQFNVSGFTLTGASSDISAQLGATNVIGFSISGDSLVAGSGTLVSLSFDEISGGGTLAIDGMVVSGSGGSLIASTGPGSTAVPGCSDADCAGVCGGTAVDDECGVCGGGGVTDWDCNDANGSCWDIADGACDCAGNVADECGVCGGGGVTDWDCNDANGSCWDIADGACDCAGNVADECGVCGGPGLNADGCCGDQLSDCNSVCGGTAVEDNCGECDGDDSTCTGCMDSTASNYDDTATIACSDCCESAQNYPTDWTVDENAFTYTGSIVALIEIDGERVGLASDLVAAFVGDEVRGVASGSAGMPWIGGFTYSVTFRSNSTSGDVMTFKYYDSANDVIWDLNETIAFEANMTLGSASAPSTLTGTANVTTDIAIATGWNWFSINVVAENMSLDNVLASLGTNATYIKNLSFFADYVPPQPAWGWYGGWWGDLAHIDNTGMYKISAINDANIAFTGAPVDPETTPIELGVGWNWIGYTPQSPMGIDQALSGLGSAGVYIKDLSFFADYVPPQPAWGWYGGWWGDLATLEPYGGYMLQTNGSATFTYPGDANSLASINLDNDYDQDELTRNESRWQVDSRQFEHNGSIMAEIKEETGFIVSEGDILAAFFENECRGVAKAAKSPVGDYYVFPLMVYGDEDSREDIAFKYYHSHTNEVVEFSSFVRYEVDMIVGNVIETFQLDRIIGGGDIATEYSLSAAYPNPFNPSTTVEFNIPVDGDVHISVYDMNGRHVDELVNGWMNAGLNEATWNAQGHTSGVYFIKLFGGSETQIQKVVLIK